ncbi:hypothetical protein D3C81_2330650 [compost metagenome]
MVRLNAGCETCRCSPAWAKLWYLATATKARSCLTFMTGSTVVLKKLSIDDENKINKSVV